MARVCPFSLGDGGFDELAELGEEVFAEVGERGIVAAAAGARGVGRRRACLRWRGVGGVCKGTFFYLPSRLHFTLTERHYLDDAHAIRNTKYGIPALSLIPPIT